MKVAIIGCSHTYVNSGGIVHEPSWTRVYALENPHIQIDNYAHFGHGHLYMDMVLKYLLYENKSYDKIVVQMTGDKRWHAAIPTNVGYNWTTQKITDNLNRVWLDTSRLVYNDSDNKIHKKLPGYIHQHGSILSSPRDDEYQPGHYSIAQYYTQLFEKQLQTIDNLSYWDYNTVKRAFIKEYGGSYVVTELKDDTMHFNEKGHQLVYEYLVKNNILPGVGND